MYFPPFPIRQPSLQRFSSRQARQHASLLQENSVHTIYPVCWGCDSHIVLPIPLFFLLSLRPPNGLNLPTCVLPRDLHSSLVTHHSTAETPASPLPIICMRGRCMLFILKRHHPESIIQYSLLTLSSLIPSHNTPESEERTRTDTQDCIRQPYIQILTPPSSSPEVQRPSRD